MSYHNNWQVRKKRNAPPFSIGKICPVCNQPVLFERPHLECADKAIAQFEAERAAMPKPPHYSSKDGTL